MLNLTCDLHHILHPLTVKTARHPTLWHRISGTVLLILSVPFTLGILTGLYFHWAKRKVVVIQQREREEVDQIVQRLFGNSVQGKEAEAEKIRETFRCIQQGKRGAALKKMEELELNNETRTVLLETAIERNDLKLSAELAKKFGNEVPIPLHKAKTAQMVRKLIAQGAQVNDRSEGKTALHQACTVEVAKALIEAGATFEEDAEGFLPIHTANAKVINFLIAESGFEIDLNKKNANGLTPLQMTVVHLEDLGNKLKKEHTEGTSRQIEYFKKVVKALVEAGANVDVTNNKGETLLEVACRTGNLHAAEALLKTVERPWFKILGGSQNLLTIACQNNHLDLAAVLINFLRHSKIPSIIAQVRFIPILVNYLIARRGHPDIQGLCHSLTLLWGYYHFLEKGEEFYKRIEELISIGFPEFQDLSQKKYTELTDQEKILEHFCNDTFYLQTYYEGGEQRHSAQTLKFASARPGIQSLSPQLEHVSEFSYNEAKNAYDDLEETLNKILQKDQGKAKFVFIGQGGHSLGIFYRNPHCFYYDPNLPSKEEARPLESVHQLVEKMVEGANKQPIIFEIEVLAQEPLSELQAAESDLIALLNPGIHLARKGKSPLHLAAAHGLLNAASALIKQGANINQEDEEGNTPLRDACLVGDLDMVKLLLQEGVEVNHRSDGYTPLSAACVSGNVEIVKELLKAHADMDQGVEDSEYTPLMIACKTGKLEVAKALIEGGALVNKKDTEGLTALMYATEAENLELVQLLLNNKADATIQSNKDKTAQMLTSNPEIIAALASAEA